MYLSRTVHGDSKHERHEPNWQTATMAEQYQLQGHTEQACAIYRRLLADQPNHAGYAERLSQLDPNYQAQGNEPMSFRELLQKMVDEVPGAQAAVIMGFDGIAIDSCEVESGAIDLPALMVEYSTAALQLRRVQQSIPQLGDLHEMNVVRSGSTCLLRPLTEDYFCALVVAPEGLLGKARYMMRIMAPKFLAEL